MIIAHDAREILRGIIYISGVEGADDCAGPVTVFHRELRVNGEMDLRHLQILFQHRELRLERTQPNLHVEKHEPLYSARELKRVFYLVVRHPENIFPLLARGRLRDDRDVVDGRHRGRARVCRRPHLCRARELG